MSAEVDRSISPAKNTDELREKLRTEGLNTVSKLLHESRAENKSLKDRNAQLERSLDIVNVKLQKAGLTEPTKSGPSDEKPLPSKNLVEGLIKENSRLKQQVEHPHKVEELSLHVYSLQSQIKTLKRDKELLQNDMTSMQQQMGQSPDVKDQRIKQLGDELKERDRRYQQEFDRNQVLSHEISELREHLHETARHCLNVSNRLPNTVRADTDTINNKTGAMREGRTQTGGDRTTDLEDKCGKLEQELELTRNQLKQLNVSVKPPQQAATTSSHSREQQLLEENAQLRRQLKEKHKEVEGLLERQKMLEHQIHVYQDDFKHEREDRQRADKQNAELWERLKKLSNLPPSQAPIASTNAWDSRHAARNSQRPKAQTVSHIRPVEGDNMDTAEDNVSLSSQTEVLWPAKLDTKLHSQSQLACWKCGKSYTPETHGDLVDHLSMCKGEKR